MNNVTENTKVIYVGIDVHKDTNSFCAYDSREDKLFAEHKSSSKFENTLHYLKTFKNQSGKMQFFLLDTRQVPQDTDFAENFKKKASPASLSPHQQ